MRFYIYALQTALSLSAFGLVASNGVGSFCGDGKVLSDTVVELDWEPNGANFTSVLESNPVTPIVDQFPGVSVSCEGYKSGSFQSFPCTLFNSANPTGNDDDLGSPNQACDPSGPGVGPGGKPLLSGGATNPNANCDALGYLLIIQDDQGTADSPDDYEEGGKIHLYFDACIKPISVTHLDAEDGQGGVVHVGNETGLSGANAKSTLSLFEPETCVHDVTLTLDGSFGIPSFKYQKCVPEVHGGGDPHFQRWTHKRDSFHGECDLVLVHSEKFGNGAGFDIHARTTVDTYYSYIEALATRIGEDIVEVEQKVLYVNGVEYTYDALPITFGTGSAQYILEVIESTKYTKKILLKSSMGKDIVTYKVYKHFVQFALRGDGTDFGDAVGLLGEYGTGDMYGRDGQLFRDFTQYAFEWQVQPDIDTPLFHIIREPQLPFEECRMPTAARPARRQLRNADNALYEQAESACAGVVNNDHDLNLCIDDIMMTGDVGLVEAW
eukprot:scaffold4833_cov233-Amphora_coffeaeformis.AAC.2